MVGFIYTVLKEQKAEIILLMKILKFDYLHCFWSKPSLKRQAQQLKLCPSFNTHMCLMPLMFSLVSRFHRHFMKRSVVSWRSSSPCP